ncbi:MAG: hypothetical protein LIO70_01205 [Clostridiales bacterium]|nr:hypothetical protein [Clostridiales bacterium]MCD7856840.1 hypothetical protein [Clostridiales bacterium]
MDSGLIALAKGKLNITWSDEGTDERVEAILEDAIPTVANMVGLEYDSANQAMVDTDGNAVDLTAPSMTRFVLLNYVAYEWNHMADTFRTAYWQEIAACRQEHALAAEEDTDDGESDSE